MSAPEYSIVVPVYNSEASLEELAGRLASVMNELGHEYELILVDDGSCDQSWEKLKEIKEANPGKVTAIRLAKNFGQHSATFCGFSFAKGNYIITIDDDLQNPPEEIPRLIEAMQKTDAELVYGIYDQKRHAPFRNLGSRMIKKISSSMGKLKEGSSFRLISASVIQKILVHHQHFVFIDEILHWYTDYISFARVEHHPRKYKNSGYSSFKIWSLLTNLAIYYTMVPLKIMVYGGVVFSIFFFLLITYFLLRKILFDVPLGYTSMIVAVLLSTSLILLSLGVLGEYLSRIYMVQNKKPLYSIKKVL